MMGSGLLGVCSRGKKLHIRFALLCLEGNILAKSLVTSGGLRVSENFEFNFGMSA